MDGDGPDAVGVGGKGGDFLELHCCSMAGGGGLFGGAPIRNDDIGARCLGCRNDRPVFQPPDTTGAPIIMP